MSRKKLEDYSKPALIAYIEATNFYDSISFRDLDRIEKELKDDQLKAECDVLMKRIFEATEKKDISLWIKLNREHDEKFNELMRLRGKPEFQLTSL